MHLRGASCVHCTLPGSCRQGPAVSDSRCRMLYAAPVLSTSSCPVLNCPRSPVPVFRLPKKHSVTLRCYHSSYLSTKWRAYLLPKHSDYATCPRNEAFPWTKRSNHVTRPREQPFLWTELFGNGIIYPERDNCHSRQSQDTDQKQSMPEMQKCPPGEKSARRACALGMSRKMLFHNRFVH